MDIQSAFGYRSNGFHEVEKAMKLGNSDVIFHDFHADRNDSDFAIALSKFSLELTWINYSDSSLFESFSVIDFE